MIWNTRTTAEDAEIITLAKAKAQCRVDSTDAESDSLLSRMVTTARRHCEVSTRLALVGKTVEATSDTWPSWPTEPLPYPPLRSITSIKYTDDTAVEATWSAADYVVDTYSGRVTKKSSASTPSATLTPLSGVKITYTCGYIYPPGSPTVYLALPEDIEHAILMCVDRFYEHRGDDLDFTDMNATARFLPPNFYWLLSRYKQRKL